MDTTATAATGTGNAADAPRPATIDTADVAEVFRRLDETSYDAARREFYRRVNLNPKKRHADGLLRLIEWSFWDWFAFDCTLSAFETVDDQNGGADSGDDADDMDDMGDMGDTGDTGDMDGAGDTDSMGGTDGDRAAEDRAAEDGDRAAEDGDRAAEDGDRAAKGRAAEDGDGAGTGGSGTAVRLHIAYDGEGVMSPYLMTAQLLHDQDEQVGDAQYADMHDVDQSNFASLFWIDEASATRRTLRLTDVIRGGSYTVSTPLAGQYDGAHGGLIATRIAKVRGVWHPCAITLYESRRPDSLHARNDIIRSFKRTGYRPDFPGLVRFFYGRALDTGLDWEDMEQLLRARERAAR